MEGLTKQYGARILVTEATYSGASDLAFLEADRVRVVGREQPVAVYILLGNSEMARSAAFRLVGEGHERLPDAYRRADLYNPRSLLDQARAVAPEETRELYNVYEERLRAMERDPPLADWDGAFSARQK